MDAPRMWAEDFLVITRPFYFFSNLASRVGKEVLTSFHQDQRDRPSADVNRNSSIASSYVTLI